MYFKLFGLLFFLAFGVACAPQETQEETVMEEESTPSSEETSEAKPGESFLYKKVSAQLGEGAVWDDQIERLLSVDIEGKKLFVLDPFDKSLIEIDVKEPIGTVVPASPDKVVYALSTGIFEMDLLSRSTRKIADPEADLPANRMNDGKCDPAGRLWVGSMAFEQTPHAAALYRIDARGNHKMMLDSISISNGICWSLDEKTMYYIDTPTQEVKAFDYDRARGEISRGRVAVRIPESMGFPDGMTIDAEGKLWIALWNGNAVSRWDPDTGELMKTYPVEAHNVSSCAFGGSTLDTLFITTARVDMSDEELARYPNAGSIFALVPGVKGVKAFRFGMPQDQASAL